MNKKTYFLYTKTFFWLIIIGGFIGCKNAEATKEQASAALVKKAYAPEKNKVSIMQLEKSAFQQELLANGSLEAHQKSILRFKVSGSLQQLLVKNGDYVEKGEALAIIDNFKQLQQLSNAKIAYKRALLELKDMLIGRGYDYRQKEEIPANIYEMATIRSGFSEAKNKLENVKFELASTTLRAPFNGKIANIKFNQYESVNAGTNFLTLIDDSVFKVEFKLIEAEVNQIHVGEHVQITAFSSAEKYNGKIVSINPMVNKNGMVKIEARMQNDGKLIDGMNVEVKIQKAIPDQFVVPKSAVVLRQNQEVLFKYINGQAFWTYVNTTHENSTSYAVIPNPNKSSATLKLGDTIIISGNLNIAHNSEVVIQKE